MANRTVKDAKTIHQTNPQYLVEKIIRSRIYESRYWKEECFGLNAELLVDKACELRYIGGIYGGNIKPTPFMCLVLKLLQIQPERDIIIEFIKQEHSKYARALGAFYMRLTGNSLDVWKYLEPLYNDYRKLRIIDQMGTFSLIHMDEYIDKLLREERVFDIILPRISARRIHENASELEPRVSLLEEELDNVATDDEDEDDVEENKEPLTNIKEEEKERKEKHSQSRKDDRERDSHRHESDRRDRKSDKEKKRDKRDREYDRERDHEHDRDHDRDRDRDRERDRDRRGREDRTPSPYSSHRRKDKKSKKSKHREKDSHSRKTHSKDEKPQSSKGSQDEVAYWNEMRAKLGLAPLK